MGGWGGGGQEAGDKRWKITGFLKPNLSLHSDLGPLKRNGLCEMDDINIEICPRARFMAPSPYKGVTWEKPDPNVGAVGCE